jgi:actin-related protein 2
MPSTGVLTSRLVHGSLQFISITKECVLLNYNCFFLVTSFQTVQEIKEKFAYVALDIAKERKLAEETTVLVQKYTLPDGRVIKVGHERFECAEALFNPSLVEVEGPGMSDLVFDVINKAEIDLRNELYSHVVLSGGSTMYPGLPSRLEHDLRNRYLKDILKGDAKRLSKFPLKIEDPPRRKHMVFLGASVLGEIMSSSSRSDKFWLSKKEYEELGAEGILNKYYPVQQGGKVK